MIKKILLFVWLCISSTLAFAITDILIYSKDRPMQLYALLESIEQRVCGSGKITVIYHTSRSEYEDGYHIVKNDFPCAAFVKQGAKPAKDFMPLTVKAIFESPA